MQLQYLEASGSIEFCNYIGYARSLKVHEKKALFFNSGLVWFAKTMKLVYINVPLFNGAIALQAAGNRL